MDKLKAVLLDLDDTLYEERDFVISGFHAVADRIAEASGAVREEVFQFLMLELRESGRGRIFNAAMRRFGIPDSPEGVASLVQLYRRHDAAISLYPGVDDLIRRLNKDYRVAVVTDGAVETQTSKVRALGLERMVDRIVYCWEIGHPKPDAECFAAALAYFRVPPAQAIVVGDHPLHDISVGKQMGALTARVRTGRFGSAPNLEKAIPDFDVPDVTRIREILCK